MKRTLYLVPALLSAFLIGCGNRQQAQQTQPIAQQIPQPLVGDQNAVQPVAVSPEPPVAQAPPPQPPAVGQPADSSEPPARRVGQYERVREPHERVREPRAEMPPAEYARAEQAPRATRERPPSEMSIPAGTAIDVRLLETIDTKRNRAGDRFDASLTRAIVVDQQTAIPRGTRFTGHLIESKPSGRLKGRAELSLSLDSFELNGRQHEIQTTHVARESGRHKKRNWTLIGGGSGLGTALGAIAGGPAGALIGAGAGAGAGTAGAVITGKKNVRLPVETPLAFTLRQSVVLPN